MGALRTRGGIVGATEPAQGGGCRDQKDFFPEKVRLTPKQFSEGICVLSHRNNKST